MFVISRSVGIWRRSTIIGMLMAIVPLVATPNVESVAYEEMNYKIVNAYFDENKIKRSTCRKQYFLLLIRNVFVRGN